MSQDMLLHVAAGAIARETRRAARDISHVQSSGQIRQAAIDTELDVGNAKVGAVTSGTTP